MRSVILTQTMALLLAEGEITVIFYALVYWTGAQYKASLTGERQHIYIVRIAAAAIPATVMALQRRRDRAFDAGNGTCNNTGKYRQIMVKLRSAVAGESNASLHRLIKRVLTAARVLSHPLTTPISSESSNVAGNTKSNCIMSSLPLR